MSENDWSYTLGCKLTRTWLCMLIILSVRELTAHSHILHIRMHENSEKQQTDWYSFDLYSRATVFRYKRKKLRKVLRLHNIYSIRKVRVCITGLIYGSNHLKNNHIGSFTNIGVAVVLFMTFETLI